MASTPFNATMDQIGYYVAQAAGGNGSIGVLLLQTVEASTSLSDRATVAAVLGANTEATFTNYVRKTLASPTRTVDNALDRVLLGGATVGTPLQITWEDAGGTANNSLSQVVFFYGATGVAVDSGRLPLMATDIAANTDGNDLVLTLHADGFARVVRAA